MRYRLHPKVTLRDLCEPHSQLGFEVDGVDFDIYVSPSADDADYDFDAVLFLRYGGAGAIGSWEINGSLDDALEWADMDTPVRMAHEYLANC